MHQMPDLFFQPNAPRDIGLDGIRLMPNNIAKETAIQNLIQREENRLSQLPNSINRSPLLDSANRLLQSVQRINNQHPQAVHTAHIRLEF